MAITTNRAYNDPALGQGFSNLAAAFGPPSGGDLAGYAAAAAAKQKADQLAWLFNNANDPLAADRASITGVQDYGQTHAGFDRADATDRYAYDKSAASAAEVARINNSGSMDRQMALPVTVNEGQTVLLPNQTSAATGLPSMFSGAMKLNPGEQVYLPNGAVLDGPAKPLSETELRAKEYERLRAAGLLTDTQILDLTLGGNAPVTVDGANGLVYMSPGEATRTGAKVGVKSTAAPETQNYITPDGAKTGTAVYDPLQGWKDTQTGLPIPEGSRTFSTANTGDASATGTVKNTEFDTKMGLIAAEMAPGIAVLADAFNGGQSVSQGALAFQSAFGDNPALKNIAQSLGIINPTDQLLMAGIGAVMNQLYIKTGAARNDSEDDRGYAELVPLSSDTPEVRQFKRDLLSQKAAGIIAQAKSPVVKAELAEAMKGLFASPQMNGPPGAAPAPQAGAAPAAPPPPGGFPVPPAEAIADLKASPETIDAFDEVFGPGAAARYLGGQ